MICRKNILLFFVLLLVFTKGLLAQGAAAFWRCDLPGGTFVVDTHAMTSVSTHEYIVDGVAEVTEVTIGATSSLIARFYYLEPIKPKSPIGVGQSLIDKAQEKAQEALDRTASATGQEPIWKKVIKNYPATTHAHTVEYRLESKDQVDKIFNSALNSWRNKQDSTLKIP